ncbi:MAG: hypothetical protein E7411_03490 [Ruminococcaceae bacterium]|nr:hypothetical protein [Oscillospiraceae bacterium]
MSKKKKIILCIVVVLIFALLAGAWLCRDLIKVVFSGVTETPEQLQQKKEELDNKQKEALESAGVENIRPLDEMEKEALDKGDITKDEAIEIITGKTTMDEIKQNKESGTTSDKPSDKPANKPSDKPADKPSDKPEEQQKPQENPVNEEVARIIGEVYVLEATFTSQLRALEVWAINEYVSVTKEQKPAKKKELAAIGFPKLAALEKECDSKVNALLSELTTVLKNAGQSTELVKQIRDAYEEKKIVTKSHYISEYM